MNFRTARAILAAGCILISLPALAAGPTRSAAPVEIDAALDALRRDNPELRVVRRPGATTPSTIIGLRVPTRGETVHDRVTGFVSEHPVLVGHARLDVEKVRTRAGRTIVALQQTHEGLPVLDRGVSVILDAEHRVRRVVGEVQALTRVAKATIDADTARSIALAHIGAPATLVTLARPGIAAIGGHGVEVFEVEASRQPLAEHLIIRVDAHAGRVLSVRNRVTH